MLVDKSIMVKVSNRTKKYFLNKGYSEIDVYFSVNPIDMNDTNRSKVMCQCEYCDMVNKISWCNYITQIKDSNIYSCHKCHYNKSKITFIEKYGTENPSSLESIKNKAKVTNLEKYGGNPSKNIDIINMRIKNSLEKYGTKYPISSIFVRDKITNTFLKKYGVENLFFSNSTFREDINNKLKISLQTDKVKNKRKDTCLEKYGFNNPLQSDNIKQKSKDTCLEKYGVEFSLQSEEIKDKSIKTCFKKYGVSHYSKTNEFVEKSKQTRVENGHQVSDEFKTPFELYRSKIDSLTKKVKDVLFENWDGYDYYDGEFIRDNFNLNPGDRLYPTIDHKISVYNGFINKISPEDISIIDNLCITKRGINSSKRDKTEEEYLLNSLDFLKF